MQRAGGRGVMNKKAQEFGLAEIKEILLALGIIIALAIIIYLLTKGGAAVVKNATSTLLRH